MILFKKIEENIDLMKVYKNKPEAHLSNEDDELNKYADFISHHAYCNYVEIENYIEEEDLQHRVYNCRAEYSDFKNIVLIGEDLKFSNGLYIRFYFKYDISFKKLETLIIKSIDYYNDNNYKLIYKS